MGIRNLLHWPTGTRLNIAISQHALTYIVPARRALVAGPLSFPYSLHVLRSLARIYGDSPAISCNISPASNPPPLPYVRAHVPRSFPYHIYHLFTWPIRSLFLPHSIHTSPFSALQSCISFFDSTITLQQPSWFVSALPVEFLAALRFRVFYR